MKNYLDEKRSRREGGFTLMEMLIVVAIIAVLIAIAIPVFTTQLENSREATDKSNLRSAYSEQMAALITWDGETGIDDITVHAEQVQENWQSEADATTIYIADGIEDSEGDSGIPVDAKTVGEDWTVSVDTDTMEITIS